MKKKGKLAIALLLAVSLLINISPNNTENAISLEPFAEKQPIIGDH